MRQVHSLRSFVQGWWRRTQDTGRSSMRDTGAVMDGELLQKLDRLTLQLGPDLISGLMGEHAARRRTSGIEFADYRQYSAGDDIRRVDWNAYARLGTLHVRQAQAEHDTVLYILVDGSPSMEFGRPSKFLTARRLAAALGYVALAHLDAVVLTTPGAARIGNTELGMGNDSTIAAIPHSELRISNSTYRGRAESGEMFRSLQALSTHSVADPDAVLAGWTAARGQGRIAVVISDLLLDAYRDGVRQLLLSGFQVNVLHLLSPDELSTPDVGDLELIDSETNAHMDIYLGNEGLKEYRRIVVKWLNECEAWCRTAGASYTLLQSDWDVERILLDILRRRGVTV